MIKCGNCHERHASVQDVRDCYRVAEIHEGHQERVERKNAEAAREAEQERQAYEGKMRRDSFYQDAAEANIISQSDADRYSRNQARSYGQHETRGEREVRQAATSQLTRAHETSPVLRKYQKVVPAGHYALTLPSEDKLRFFKVNTPTEGRWDGYTFVDEVVGGGYQGSETSYSVRSRDRRNLVLTAIAEDVKGARRLYGQKIGKCGHCNRTLTDEDSRARGIGPVCANKGF